PQIVVATDTLILDEQVVEEARVVGRGRVLVARESEPVLLLARDVPLLRRDLHALAHREPGPGLDDAREARFEVLRPQLEPRRQALDGRATSPALEQNRAIPLRVHQRHVADTVGAARDPGIDDADRDLARE